jgi:type II secretory pathway pseudopilin PulG
VTGFLVIANRDVKWALGFALVFAVLAVAFVLFRATIVDTKEEQTRQDLMAIKMALIKFKEERGHYPSESEGLRILVDPSPRGKYFVDDRILNDPWGHPLIYRTYHHAELEGFVVYSLGPTGIDRNGKGDNIALGMN